MIAHYPEWIATTLWVVWVVAHPIRPKRTVDDSAASNLTRCRGAGQAVLTHRIFLDCSGVPVCVAQTGISVVIWFGLRSAAQRFVKQPASWVSQGFS